MSEAPWPTDLTYSRSKRILSVTFDNGERYDLPAELLRVESPSVGNRLIAWMPDTPDVSAVQLSVSPWPSDVRTPMPVTATIGRPR